MQINSESNKKGCQNAFGLPIIAHMGNQRHHENVYIREIMKMLLNTVSWMKNKQKWGKMRADERLYFLGGANAACAHIRAPPPTPTQGGKGRMGDCFLVAPLTRRQRRSSSIVVVPYVPTGKNRKHTHVRESSGCFRLSSTVEYGYFCKFDAKYQ